MASIDFSDSSSAIVPNVVTDMIRSYLLHLM